MQRRDQFKRHMSIHSLTQQMSIGRPLCAVPLSRHQGTQVSKTGRVPDFLRFTS